MDLNCLTTELFHVDTSTPEDFKIFLCDWFTGIIKGLDSVIKVGRFLTEKLILGSGGEIAINGNDTLTGFVRGMA